MPSYTTSLRLVQPATGEYSGTWGTEVNNGLTALVDASIAGTSSITMTAANFTLTTANGASDQSRAMFLVLGGTPGASYAVIVPSVSKLYFVTNNTGFAQTVRTSGTGISVPNGASMTLRCDGTNVVVAQNYFASMTLGSALPTGSGGTGLTSYTSGGVVYASSTSALATGSGLVFDGSNLGIGTSSPARTLDIDKASATFRVRDATGGNDFSIKTIAGPVSLAGSVANTSIGFMTNDTERMRLDSSGNFLVGKTAIDSSAVGIELRPGGIANFTGNLATTNELVNFNNANTGNVAYDIAFRQQNTVAGSIRVNATSTSYNTSSDYRLKNNPQPLTGSGAFIDALKPKTWLWNVDGSVGAGFLAHEAQEVSPSSVVGEKDAVDADGDPIMQAMEYGSAEFIANIVAELQSLRARVAALEKT
jgi:hypothetical protein